MGHLSNKQKKIYASLATTKGRKENGLFIAQGTKCVCDTIEHFRVESLLATPQWIADHRRQCELIEATEVAADDLRKITTLVTPPDVIAVYHIPEETYSPLTDKLVLALDGLQDPGNMGTIIRVADWMGVDTIIASKDTVDVWSPKVVQSTMGAIARVSVRYCDLETQLCKLKEVPVYGTFMHGDNIYDAPLSENGVIVMGNEGRGIRKETERIVTRRLTIPSYPQGRPTSESLNVAVATSIVLAEFRRRLWQK